MRVQTYGNPIASHVHVHVNVHLHVPRLHLHGIWFTILQGKFTTIVGNSLLHLKILKKSVNQFYDEVQGTIFAFGNYP